MLKFPAVSRWCISFLIVGLALMAGARADGETTEELARRVILLANANDPESVQLAEYYAAKRGVPAENIVALPLSRGETIPWAEFTSTLFNPLQAWLVERGWVDGIGMDLTDEFGRRKYAMSGHSISFLVVCRGVPLRVGNEAAWLQNDQAQKLPRQFQRNSAAIDSELTVIAASGTPVNAFIPNPLFRLENPLEMQLDQIVRVSRLDGPSFAVARDLVDAAVEVERTGLIGRAYIDRGGPFKHGDAWLETAEKTARAAGWDVASDTKRGTMEMTDRADGMAFYFGWYTGGVNGPFKLPGFRLARGAVALHIHSYSARSLRLESGGGWTGPLVARGAAASFGNVDEPYLEFTHRPDILIAALLRGARLGEAAFEALPAVSWAAIGLGDPLYQPFAVGLDTQIEEIERLPLLDAAYVAMRQMLKLEAAGDAAGAIEYGRRQLTRTPSLALGLAVAERLHAAGNDSGAALTLGFSKWVTRAPASDWGLLATIAERLAEWGDAATAVAVWRKLFDYDLPDNVRKAWLETAKTAASKSGQTAAALEFDRALSALSPPESPAADAK